MYKVISTEAPNYDATGWCQRTGLTNHTILMDHVASLSDSSLIYVREDSKAAARALPDGRKTGHYVDTAHYCGMEIAQRKSSSECE